jgi:multimeric flavodoxin WrbA
MRILAVIGSRKKGNTSHTVRAMGAHMKSVGEVAIEYLYLHDYQLKYCLGCRVCFDRGETECPGKDDVMAIVDKMKNADGVIFASPSFLNDATGIMKTLIDRTAYFSHRPAFYTKCAYIITTTHATGNKSTRDTMAGALLSMGFHYVGSLGLKIPTVSGAPDLAGQEDEIQKAADKFYQAIARKKYLSPSLVSLIIFKMKQNTWGSEKEHGSLDHKYWRERGFLDPHRNYYLETHVNWAKRSLIRVLKRIFFVIYG